MKRKYTKRGNKEVTCIDCSEVFLTGANNVLRCTGCRKSAEYRNNMLDPKWRIKKLLAGAKFRATSQGIPFNIDLEYLVSIYTGKCQVTGRNFDLTGWGEFGQVNPNAPSIDKIIPKLGYVKGNVRFITYHANVAISEYGLDCFKQLASDVLAFRG